MMQKLHKLSSLILLALILTLPFQASAQEVESTEEAITETSGDVTVIVESPTPGSESINQTELVFAALFLISLLVNALQAFWLNKSVPADLANRIFGSARLLALQTPSKADDKIVDVLEKGYQELSTPSHNPSESRD